MTDVTLFISDLHLGVLTPMKMVEQAFASLQEAEPEDRPANASVLLTDIRQLEQARRAAQAASSAPRVVHLRLVPSARDNFRRRTQR